MLKSQVTKINNDAIQAVKKCICLVTSSLVGGGAEKLNLTLMDYLKRQGHKVSLIVLSSHNIDYDVKSDDVYFLDHSFKKPALGFLHYSFKAKSLDRLIKRIERHNRESFDFIMASLSGTHKLFARLDRRNVLYWVHNTFSKELESYFGSAKYEKKIKEYQKIYKNKKLIVTSKGVKDDLVKTFEAAESNIKVLYNFFDFDQVKELSEQGLELPFASKQYLIHVGRFSQQKRHDILFEAYKNAGVDLPLVLLCKDSEELQALIKAKGLGGKVFVAGFQQNPYVWIRNARMMVLSSDFEGFGNVIVESLFLQTPVVSTDCASGPREIMIGDFADGLAKTSDAKDLADKIKFVMSRDFDYETADIERRFSVDVFVSDLFNYQKKIFSK